ncbi:MAG: hypothetical protein N2448_01590 [Caloramator sp.]|nr:hypothetical protein [Caloramator sp.]
MFSIGEWIFYPVFGAGLIINIEEKRLFDKIRKYYVIKFINGIDMMIPVCSKESSKLRKVISKDECKEIYEILCSKPENMSLKWTDRYRYYKNCINEGDIRKLSRILRNIGNLSKVKKLSKSELNIYNDILDIVAGEVCAVLNEDFQKIKQELNTLTKS